MVQNNLVLKLYSILGAIKNNLVYYKRIHDEIKARKTRSSLIHLRKKWLEKQRVSNYQNEYDRIRGILADSKTGDLTADKLKERSDMLEKMGAIIIDQIV